MKNNLKFNPKNLVLIAIIILASLSRLIPHVPNFSPLGAISLFGAAFFKQKWKAFLIPIVSTWCSDLLINNIYYAEYHSSFIWFYSGYQWQILSYGAIILFGLNLFKTKITFFRLGFGALGSGIIFFVISNFGVWLNGLMYSKDLIGLFNCYVAGVPFLKGTFLGNFFYVPTIFGTYLIIQKLFPFSRSEKIVFN